VTASHGSHLVRRRSLRRGIRSNQGTILSNGALYGGGGIGDRWGKRKNGDHRGRDDHEAKRSFFFRVEAACLSCPKVLPFSLLAKWSFVQAEQAIAS
jgi:hypothetical protein